MKGQNKTEVFIITQGMAYEGENIIGVYASEELALKKAKTIKPSRGEFTKVESSQLHLHEWSSGPYSHYLTIDRHKVMEK